MNELTIRSLREQVGEGSIVSFKLSIVLNAAI